MGCREEGRRRQTVYTDGRYWDEILFGLTRDEFADIEQAAKEIIQVCSHE